MYGDFNFKCEFNTGIKTQVKFYFWLNVSALLYNEELRKLTDVRDKYREELIASDPDEEIAFKKQTKTEKGREDYYAPIHFEEFQLIDEDQLK